MARPHVTLKLATSLDGKIALANGQSEWITGDKAREAGRKLRASHEAIVIGANTAVLDNPQLTARIDGETDPVRVVFDSTLRISPDSNLVRTAHETPVVVFCKNDLTDGANELKRLGVQVLPLPHSEAGLDIEAALDILHGQGIRRLLLEGGGTLAASFVREGAVDVIDWFRAPIILGGDGRDAIGALGLKNMNNVFKFDVIDSRMLGIDRHERYQRVS